MSRLEVKLQEILDAKDQYWSPHLDEFQILVDGVEVIYTVRGKEIEEFISFDELESEE